MKFAIYGVSRSGKNYFINFLKNYFNKNAKILLHIEGSTTLNDIALSTYNIRFKECDEIQKNKLREKFVNYVNMKEKEYQYIVVDGHYSFFDNKKSLFKVCTQLDIECYDKFFYLDTTPSKIVDRLRKSEGDKKNDNISEDEIKEWQEYEIKNLTNDLLQADKELNIFEFKNDSAIEYVYESIVNGKYDSKQYAQNFLANVKVNTNCVILVDCDKTLSMEDSTEMAFKFNNISLEKLKDIFNGDRYTSYQSFEFDNLLNSLQIFKNNEVLDYVIENIQANKLLINDLKSIYNIEIFALTAGCTQLWEKIINKFDLNIKVLKDNHSLMTKYTKYFIVKALQEQGKFVLTIGDSLLDALMLKQANKSYIITQKGYRMNIHNFLKSTNNVFQLSYQPKCYDDIGCDDAISLIKVLPKNDEIQQNINFCKSESNIIGSKLRFAHYKLGQSVAKQILTDYKNESFVVIVMLRSGVPFGMSIGDFLDCPVLFYDDKSIFSFDKQLEENPQLQNSTFIIVDAVINTGKTICELITRYELKKYIIATNVLSNMFKNVFESPIYTSRISEHNYTGSKQKIISNGKGPDTADRLFKLI